MAKPVPAPYGIAGSWYSSSVESMTIAKFNKFTTVSPPPRPKSWLGSFRSSGTIQGDIVSPPLDEASWDVLRT